ncbi:BnaC03g54870D [Brassica napus]|uniref:BnaC03g54870D protein n=1 Tax=Brassica napus TaxID=3708 RepID=A0A078F2H0_BRANA|nr:BnaC03g54870D [Brassica napus]
MNPELLAFPSSLVGGRPRPRGLFTDPFSSPVPSWGNVPEVDTGFYHLRSRDGTPLIEEPSRGIGCNYPFGDDWRNRYVLVKIQEPVGFWIFTKPTDVSPLRHSRVWGNMVKLPVSAIYDEHQKAKTRKRRPLYTLPPRLERSASLVNGSSSNSSTGAEALSNHDPLVDAHRRLIGEVFFLRN